MYCGLTYFIESSEQQQQQKWHVLFTNKNVHAPSRSMTDTIKEQVYQKSGTL